MAPSYAALAQRTRASATPPSRVSPTLLRSVPLLQLGVDGGAGDPTLRPYWRGRMGLSRLEQRDLFESVRAPPDA